MAVIYKPNLAIVRFVSAWSFILLRVSVAIAGVITFFSFQGLRNEESLNIRRSIEVLLRNEIYLSNSYALSKSLVDLESLGIIRAAKLIEANTNRWVYYNSFDETGNRLKKLIVGISSEELMLKGINGITYNLLFLKRINVFSLIVELTIYLTLIAISIIIPSYIRSSEARHRQSLKAIELEKKLILDITKRVQHDVASPLTVLRSVLNVLHDVDPEVKEVLSSAITRTQEIFDDFNSAKEKLQNCDILECLNSVRTEKELIWQDRIRFELDSKTSFAAAPLFVKFDQGQLKRIISNIINNSFDAFYHSKSRSKSFDVLTITIKAFSNSGKVAIEIQDNGPGFQESYIHMLGSEGFSYGKENSVASGQGIALFHAKAALESLGGSIQFRNSPKGGAIVTCLL